AHGRFVLDHEDGFRAAPTNLLHGLVGFSWGGRLVDRRQEYLEGSSFAELAFHVNPSLVLFDDAIRRCQSQSRPLPDLLGRNKWFENAAQILRHNPAAGIDRAHTDEQ